MNEPIELKKNKERSPNFPFIPVEVALQRAQMFYSHERRGAAPPVSAARHWGYSETSSAFKQTLGALKSYGLLVDDGGRMRLTESALRILLDSRPDSIERDSLIRQAALNPPIASEIFQRWPTGLPSEHTLAHFLMFDRGFQEDAATRVVKILRLNDHFAKISRNEFDDDMPAATAAVGTVVPSMSEQASAMMERMEAYQALTNPNQSLVNPHQHHHVLVDPHRGVNTTLALTTHDFPAQPAVSASQQTSSTRSEKIIDPDGMDVTLSFGGEPTQETYEFLADYVQLRIKQFQRKTLRTNSSTSPATESDT
ncbi:hypothetical protein GXB81_14665 [Paraburkholderia sp. Ac-20336]|uniref:hypothetical protein n=1 Tax=Burkholderiaceae TaxID=119060 RepID=UPI0014203A6B|nr:MULTISPECIES: hypothetical protein [Burkholderiaceae]MBN3804286.1 hypothetical protein [Paraburkholderia sp. Ac-20336]NIF52495.1 hypothetical protein [Burkholderia sp. Ax-1724]